MMVTQYTGARDTSWVARVDLDDTEWPHVDASDDWLDRPIYRWVTENCEGAVFLYLGTILFDNRDDFTQFLITWS